MNLSDHDNVNGKRRVLLANPRGFCAGVTRAIDAVEQALSEFGAPVFVRRAIVHNRDVVKRLENLGAVFVEEIDQIPDGAHAILSAHGSARSVKRAAEKRNLHVIDTICPLVAKVHSEVETWYRQGRHILLIGHAGHPEIVGTMGQLPSGAISLVTHPNDLEALDLAPNTAVAYAVQTTFALRDAKDMIDAIMSRFTDATGPRASDICYATTNRQHAVQAIAVQSDLVLVVGDTLSSNARRLVEVAEQAGTPARLVSGADDLPLDLLDDVVTIGLTAAASAPETAVQEVCARLVDMSFHLEEGPGQKEDVRFRPVPLHSGTHSPQHLSPEDRLARLRKDLDDTLNEAIGQSPERDVRLAEAMRYAVVGAGKRFRALLITAVSDLVGGSYPHALRVAAAIECVHAQSLVHDDLPAMDNDDMRRGRLTLHRKFDEATAILAGDALLALAFEILADERTHPDGNVRSRLVLGLAKAIGQDGLAGGQMMDLYPSAHPTAKEVFACQARKTGALIRYSVEAGALLGNCDEGEYARLMHFAENLGLVFQIRDDMLDMIGESSVVGKALNKDAAMGRKSATTLLGLEGAATKATLLEDACHQALAPFGPRATPLRDLANFAVNRLH